MPSSSGPRWRITSVIARTSAVLASPFRSRNPAIPHILTKSYHPLRRDRGACKVRLVPCDEGRYKAFGVQSMRGFAIDATGCHRCIACDNQNSKLLRRPRVWAECLELGSLAGMSQHATEVAAGERFEFGKNWAWFLETLNDEKIEEAVKSLQGMLETDTLAGMS